MKLTTTVAILLSLGAVAYSLPIESKPWALIPDGAGRFHMINIDPANVPHGEDEFEPLFNPEQDVVFRLFTRRNPVHAHVLDWSNPASISNSNFAASNPTRFLIHGWIEGEDATLHWVIKDHYLRVGDFNVIAVDWGAGAQTINYIAARNRVGGVGMITSRLIDVIRSTTGQSRDLINVIGFSLGGHAAGNTGKGQGGQLNSVIALDPAGPLFSQGQADALSASDALYTEAIYTNAGLLAFDAPLCHANFYPNGGRSQPGCITSTCAHNRVNELFAESVSSSTHFVSMRCANYDEILSGRCTSSGPYANMGGEPSNRGRGVNGVYHLMTNSASPFARG
ncbi:pancreatic triacylglycerol lipase-like [Topomyia yanbarensis]|uniref:pancreatic triacylglycerol lipase-like n=1 Tax=Topomyia yanbarensis TaxID=2498891 RepID=UPI00273BE769|nr:pancreatic triacylglycerol lipase-like [Topomyia yanbarensis]XP_058840118.1 pancreatic triacylglycerol lipase-like [Topomyia yanbarensis]